MLSNRLKYLWLAAASVAIAVASFGKTPPRGESRYEIVNNALAPIIAVLTRNGNAGNHALNIEATVGDVSGLPPQMKGAHLRIAYEFPDKLLVQFPTPNGPATVCRNAQSVWAFPSALFLPIVERVDPPISSQPLPPMEIEQKKAVFLPALLDVRDGGSVAFGGRDYRMLDVRPIAFTKKQQSANSWPGRVWINAQDHQLAQLALNFSNWSATLAIDKLEFAPALPPQTWTPPPDQKEQVTAVPGEKIFTLIERALKQSK